MQFSTAILAGLLVLLNCHFDTTSANQIPVEIFYETLNVKVRSFFVDQFETLTEHLWDHVNVTLIPYGNTVWNETETEPYQCPFGDSQCEANKFHACVLKFENSDSDDETPLPEAFTISHAVANFTNCFFKNRYADEEVDGLAERCMPTRDWIGIWECVRESNRELTEQLRLATVPVAEQVKLGGGLAVRINGTISTETMDDMVEEICKLLVLPENDQLEICNKRKAEKVKVAIYYETLDQQTATYVSKQLGPYFHILEDFISLELIPYGNTELVEGSDNYTCASGTSQCISNKFQALLVDEFITNERDGQLVSGPNRVVNFLKCQFGTTGSNQIDILEKCSQQTLPSDSYTHLIGEVHVNSDRMKKVYASMRDKTNQVANSGKLERVPTVTVNGTVSYNAFNDLIQEVCAQSEAVLKPSICKKVKVTVVYNALDHKSRTFFIEYLKPIFNNLHNLIELELLPAGHAHFVSGQSFICPGGVDQCDALKLQACALDNFWNDGSNYTDPVRQEVFDFIWCTFKNKQSLSVYEVAENCINQHVDLLDAWLTIHGCMVDGSVEPIFDEIIEEAESHVSGLENITLPLVKINDQLGTGQIVSDWHLIREAICNNFDSYHSPDFCFASQPPKVELSVYYEATNEGSKQFFTKQFDPWYKYVEEMADIKLYPSGNDVASVKDVTCESYEKDSLCFANAIQAYIINEYQNENAEIADQVDGTYRTMNFLSCVFGHPNFQDDVVKAAEYCVSSLSPDEWFNVVIGVKSADGSKIYKDVLQQTKEFKEKIGVTSFNLLPWVTMESHHSKRAANDLLKAICNSYTGELPLECTPVQVDIYYEALNPVVRRYFIDQVIPTFRHLRERITVNLIPYGRADSSSTLEKECAANEKLCTANKLQACAINQFFGEDIEDTTIQYDGQNQTLKYVYCMFKNIRNLDIVTLSEECANNNLLMPESIHECAMEGNGTELLKQMRTKTLNLYEYSGEPLTVVINGDLNREAVDDLQTIICNNIVGDKPVECNSGLPAKVKVQFHYSAKDPKTQSFVEGSLYLHYRDLEDIIDLDIVPFGLMEILEHDDGKYTLVCPNGPSECNANQIHACVINRYWNDEIVSHDEYDGKLQTMEFLHCYFTNGSYPSNVAEAAESCVHSVFGDSEYENIDKCVKDGEGVNILLDYQNFKVNSLVPTLSYQPWITVNNRHSYSVEHHFQTTVCDTYDSEEKPQVCLNLVDEQDPVPAVEIHYEPESSVSRDFFVAQLNLSLTHINDVAGIKLIPFGRTTKSGDKFVCPNDEECHSFKQHACVMDHYLANDTINTLKFVACTFGDRFGTDDVNNACADEVFLDAWVTIDECARTDGDRLLQQYYDLTQELRPKISHVPWIIINGEHNMEAEVNLINEVCVVYYSNDKPDACHPEMLSVDIYYETKNDDVTTFMMSQLALFVGYLDEIADFTFTPYGLTKQNEKNFECSSGVDQCNANKIHACVINRFYNQSIQNNEVAPNRIRTANFIVCSLEHNATFPIESAEYCLEQNFVGDYWRDIDWCARGAEGDELMQEMARKTNALQPSLTTVPYVAINKAFQSKATIDLYNIICNQYGIVKPVQCSLLPSGAIQVGIYFSSNEAGKNYLIEHLLPFYKEIVPILDDSYYNSATEVAEDNSDPTSEAKLHAIIEPKLIPWGKMSYDPNNLANPFQCDTDNECYSNRMLACVNYLHGDEPKSSLHIIEFALCFYSHPSFSDKPQDAANQCSNRIWIPDPFASLEVCATQNNQEFIDAMVEMKDLTEHVYPPLDSFPSVTVSNMVNSDAVSNLISVVCNQYKGSNIPSQCESYIDGSTTEKPTTPDPNGSNPTAALSSIVLLLLVALISVAINSVSIVL